MKMRTVSIASVLFALTPASADAATFGYREVHQGAFGITMVGPIIPGDAATLEQKYNAITAQGYRVSRAIGLNSPGGNIVESLKIADFVKRHGLGANAITVKR